mmetsp:Transcript_22686/g.59200  ORF Transcript_22686/g.59200 Transcript_22686/m.59200 type:complete len:231 (+) Transcript_22686:342-1034(+)
MAWRRTVRGRRTLEHSLTFPGLLLSQVTTVVNGREGLMKMQTCSYDVAFVDFHMPVQTGIHMLRRFVRNAVRCLPPPQPPVRTGRTSDATRPAPFNSYRIWCEENNRRPIHLVGMSASASEAEVEDARAEGMHIFQRKPLTVKNMRSILSSVPTFSQKDGSSSCAPAEEPASENEPAHNTIDAAPSVDEAACSQPSKRRRVVTEASKIVDDEADAEEQAAAGGELSAGSC